VKHQCVGGGHLVDVGTLATMVQEVSTITLATGDGGNKGVIITTYVLQKIPIFAKHDVKTMVQQVASNPISIMWGLPTIVFENAYAQPQVLEFCNLGLVCTMH